MNIVEHIFAHAAPSDVALIHDGAAVTYGQLRERVEAAAAGIGRVAAARVGLDCPNGVEHVVLALAIVRAGKVLVPIASELSLPERERVMRETALGAVVDGAGKIRTLSTQAASFDEAALAALNPAFIRFSSGTTGRSKGIVLSHQSLLDRLRAANRGLAIGPGDRVVWVLPMAHHFAVSIMLYLAHGATTIIENSHLAEDVLRVAATHGGTVLYGSPFHHALLAADQSALRVPTLRLAVSTAAALREEVARNFALRHGVPLTQGLGLIEVGLPLLNIAAANSKPASIGRPQTDFEARLDGATGELLLRGPGMLDAYLHPWRSRAEVLDGGWFRTGDLARCDADGDYFLQGRLHSVINVAGMKCFPEEVEAALNLLPGVKAARVLGREHARFGAVPVAEIVPDDFSTPPTTQQLIAHCREHLARHEVPVEFRFVEAVPRTASGKIQRGMPGNHE